MLSKLPEVQALLADGRYGLVRQARAGSWAVQIRREGQRHGRAFADAKHGGEQGAYLAARAWRDALILKLGPIGSTPPRWQPPPNYTTGLPASD